MTGEGADRFDALVSAARERARRAGSVRQAAAAGLFEPASRLTDQRRSLILQIADGLTARLAESIRTALAADPSAGPFRASLADVQPVELAMRLAELPALRSEQSLLHLFRRADEYCLVQRIRRIPPKDGRSSDVLADLARAADPGLAKNAMAVVVALAARDALGGSPCLPADDLPPELLEAMTWQVAAALRQVAGATAFDASIQRAARTVFAGVVPERGIAQRAVRLAGALIRYGHDQDRIIIDLLASGALHAAAAMIALRADLPMMDCFDTLLDDDPVCWSILVAGAAIETRAAADFFALLGAAHARPAAESEAMAQFRGMPALRRAEILAWWRLDPAYRAALAQLRD